MRLTPNAYNLIVEISEKRLNELETILQEIQEDLYSNKILPFGKIKSIHFARFVIIPKSSGRKEYPAQLAFSTNYDGELKDHLMEIIQCPNADIDKIFSCCLGYVDRHEHSKLKWLMDNGKKKAYFYRGTWSRNTEQIVFEKNAREQAENYIDSIRNQDLSAQEYRTKIIENAKSNNTYRVFDPIKTPALNVWQIVKIILLVLTLILFLPIVLLFILVLLWHEIRDDKREHKNKYRDQEKTQEFVKLEDRIVQNQLTHLVEIKPGIFRLFTLKLVLNGIAYLAKFLFNKGKLGDIPTIHFARWIIIDGGKRLLFFSNFDGSWENYLGDFIDKAAVGLTAVWSNTVEFPKTRLLVTKGATDEQRFKSWTRDKQIATQVWFSAYPDLTVRNIANNTAIQQGLSQNLTDKERDAWLMRY